MAHYRRPAPLGGPLRLCLTELAGMSPTLDIGAPIRSWAVLVTLGVLVCWALAMRRTARLGHDRVRVFLWLLTAFPVGAACAALGAGVVRVALGATDRVVLGDAATGMTVLGAVLGCLVYSVAWARLVLRTSPWALLDAVAFTYPLALAFGRVGCLLNGCCFGHEVDAALGPLTVPLDSYAPGTAAAAFFRDAAPGTLLVNLPLVLAALALVTLAVSEWTWRRRASLRLVPGTVLVVTLATDAATRFLAELLRAGPNPWQLWVLVTLLAALAALAVLWARRGRVADALATPPPEQAVSR